MITEIISVDDITEAEWLAAAALNEVFEVQAGQVDTYLLENET